MAGYTLSQTDYRAAARMIAGEYNIDPGVFERQIEAESSFNPYAVSKAGAIGLGQLMPGTARSLGVNPWNPLENLRGAARYMRQLLDQFGGNMRLALAGYNAGPGAVQQYGGVPPYQETQDYVAKILGPLAGVLPSTLPGAKVGTAPAGSASTSGAAAPKTPGPSETPELVINTPAGQIRMANPFSGVATTIHNMAVRGVAIGAGSTLVIVGLMIFTKTNPASVAVAAATRRAAA